jgi:phosphoribosylanthranilate isomerase
MTSLRIKICGITNEADARQAGLLGADAIGLNFYAQSPRRIDPVMANFILRELPLFVEPVGVFVDQPLHEVFNYVNRIGAIRTIQWYGDNRELGDPFPFHLIAAFPVRDQKSLLAINRYLDLCRGVGHLPAAILADAHVAGKHGGTGKTVPWKLLTGFRPEVPLILAGGLTPENVAEAIRIVHPYAVDVASGVEFSPGQKDPEKMRRFIGNAREAAEKMKW